MLDREQIEMWDDAPSAPLVKLKWITPEAEREIVEIARVSADPKKKSSPDHVLIGYLLRNHHWSPFEMANICFEVNTTRDIGRQMLRHWTMRPQEFSQRYQDVAVLGDPVFREARLQHKTNRQASVQTDDAGLTEWWALAQREAWRDAEGLYREALESGVAKEVARAVLPEGLTPTRLYFNAPIRSALHFCALRLGNGSQKETTAIAQELYGLLVRHMPNVMRAFDDHQATQKLADNVVRWVEEEADARTSLLNAMMHINS